MLKVGIIGCGAIADAHGWAIPRTGRADMVAACDAEPLMARQFCERFGVPAQFSDVDSMLAKAKPDVVHVLTPPQLHFALARKCLESGVHVYLEKPFVLHPAEAEELFALAVAKKLKLTVGHDALFSPAAREMRRIIDSGYLGGAPIHVESYYGYEFGNTYGNAILTDRSHWVRKLPGKLLQNVISHGVARIIEYLVGARPKVLACGFVSPLLKSMGEEEIVDELRVTIQDEKGATAYFTFSSRMRPTVNQFRVFGPKNGLFMDETQQSVIRMSGRRFKSYAEKFIPSMNLARQHLGNLVRNARLFMANDFNVEEGKRFLAEAFYRAIEEGSPLPISFEHIRLTTVVMDDIFNQIAIPSAASASP
jgi:predicted dehydrogenase